MRFIEPLKLLNRTKTFFSSYWLFFGASVCFVFLFTVLTKLYRDGQEVFLLQRDALTLQVFSRTDLNSESCALLEEQLRALNGVKEVISISPEESLKKLAADPELAVESEWLSHKSAELKGKSAVLPWSYDLHLLQWDENFLKSLMNKIENLEVGVPKRKVVSEIHYDKERWAFASALFNYLRWLRSVLWVALLFLLGFLIVVFVKWVRGGKWFGRNFVSPGAGMDWQRFGQEAGAILIFGISAGFVSHLLSILVLALSYFNGASYWRNQIGEFLPQQIFCSIFLILLSYGHHSLGGKTRE